MSLDDEPWAEYGTCMTADPELFFPDVGEHVNAAKRVCALCPVVLECAEYAIRVDERHGIWGGLSEKERRPYVRAARIGA
jgi:WhiB family redox-sensing transcriptional regulator